MCQRKHKELSSWATIERRKDSTRMANTSLYRTGGGPVRVLVENSVGGGRAPRPFTRFLARMGIERVTARQGGPHRAAQEFQKCGRI